MKTEMLKLCKPFPTVGTVWDHCGKSEISQIFISTSARSRIDFIQFAYVDQDGIPVLSERIGGGSGSSNLQTITFDYPTEHITRLKGCYLDDAESKNLCSIIFHTNKHKYGPYGLGRVISFDDVDLFDIEELTEMELQNEFNYEVGGEFFGFFGTFKSNCVESIGLYMKPLPLPKQARASR
ncbi:hypothetical protein OROMI_030617 [Orobanche minor]